MEGSNAWRLVTRNAGMTAVGASAFPLVALIVGTATRSVPQAYGIAQMGTILLATAVLVTIVGMMVGGREALQDGASGCGWIGGAVISLLGQLVLAVVIGMAWSGLRSRDERPVPRTRTIASRPSPQR